MESERWRALMNEPDDDKAVLTPDELAVGWHWCWDFDGLLVGPGMPEAETCSDNEILKRNRKTI